jgi:hypothetical protein
LRTKYRFQAKENSEEEELFDDRVLPSLAEELASQRERLIFKLNEWWGEFVSCTAHREDNVVVLSIWPSQIESISEVSLFTQRFFPRYLVKMLFYLYVQLF